MLQTIEIIIKLIPLIIKLIKVIEEELPDSGKGGEKLQYVKDVITIGYPAAQEIWGSLEKIVNTSVALFNATGIFKKG